MAAALKSDGCRARILRVTRQGATSLSDICRRVQPSDIASRRDHSLHRLKTTSAIRALKADGLITRTATGWTSTPAGAALIADIDRPRTDCEPMERGAGHG